MARFTAMKLYEYAVIKQALLDRDDVVTDPAAVLVSPTTVLANDLEEAKAYAARAIPDEEIGNMERIEILVKSFG